ncbi:MAG: hypothetical protein ACJAWV_001614 [Flammeovirgaceae bacterium]|jgi:hypothetical protein
MESEFDLIQSAIYMITKHLSKKLICKQGFFYKNKTADFNDFNRGA